MTYFVFFKEEFIVHRRLFNTPPESSIHRPATTTTLPRWGKASYKDIDGQCLAGCWKIWLYRGQHSCGVGGTKTSLVDMLGPEQNGPHLADNIFNSLAPGRFEFHFRQVIFKLTLVNGGWGISYEIALRWMPPDLTDDKSTLVQVMAWCRQATSHYLSQCWRRSLSPCGVTTPQWVKCNFFKSSKFCTWFHKFTTQMY